MKLELTKGLEWDADFTIVSDDGVTGEILDPSDTGIFRVSTSGVNPSIVIDGVVVTVQDADNGTVNVVLSAEQTSLLNSKIGFAEDMYPTLSNYVGVLDLTLVSGNRTVYGDLYVRDIGL